MYLYFLGMFLFFRLLSWVSTLLWILLILHLECLTQGTQHVNILPHYSHILHPLPFSTLLYPILPSLVLFLLCSFLLFPVLSCPVVSCRVVSCRVVSCPIVQCPIVWPLQINRSLQEAFCRRYYLPSMTFFSISFYYVEVMLIYMISYYDIILTLLFDIFYRVCCKSKNSNFT